MVSFPTESVIHDVCVLYNFPKVICITTICKEHHGYAICKNDVHVISEFDSFIFQITFILFQRKDLQPPESIYRDISVGKYMTMYII